MTSPCIRRARAGDAPAASRCIDGAYAGARARGIALPPVSEGVDADIRDHLVWVARSAERIVGVIVVSVAGERAHLMNIAVHPEAGGRGLGRGLIETALSELRARQVQHVDLATHVDMPENVALYSHLGWRVTGAEADKVQMSLNLNGNNQAGEQ